MKSILNFSLMLIFWANIISSAVASTFLPNGPLIADINSHPAMAVGLLQWSLSNESSNCTAFLVSKDILVTASHCILGDDGKKKSGTLTFYPRWPSTEGATVAKVITTGTKVPRSDWKNDWALLRVPAIGLRYGWFGVRSINLKFHLNRKNFHNFGYSAQIDSGNTLTVTNNCQFKGSFSGEFLNDCNLTHGGSGGPIFYEGTDGRYYVVAIQVAEGAEEYVDAEYSAKTANYAAPSSSFMGALNSATKHFAD